MSLLDIFPEMDCKAPEPKDITDFEKEIKIIMTRHKTTAPQSLIRELASLITDPPPWHPWS